MANHVQNAFTGLLHNLNARYHTQLSPKRLVEVLFIFIFFFSSSHGTQANTDTLTHLSLPTSTLVPGEEISFTQDGAYLSDPSNEMTLENVLLSGSWHKSQEENLNLGFSKDTYWFAARINTLTPEAIWFLRVRYSLFDFLKLYVCPAITNVTEDQCHTKRMGDQYPFSERDILHPEFVAKLPFKNSSNHWVLLQIQTEGSFPMMVKISDKRTTTDSLIMNFGVRGAYISMMLVMGLYNLFLFFSTRDRTYFYYSAFVLSFLTFHMTYSGSLFFLVWPDHPEINSFALPLAFSINLMFMSLFISKFLSLRTHSKPSYYLFRCYLAAATLLLLLNSVLSYQLLTKFTNILAIIMGISAIVIGTRFWISGLSSARLFTIAFIAFILGFVLASSRSLGFAPLNVYTLFGYQIGSFIEILLLSLALGERIIQLRKDKKESQQQAIQHLQDYEELYNNSITGQFQLDEFHNIIKANKSFYRMTGSNPKSGNDSIHLDTIFQSENEKRSFWKEVETEGLIQNHMLEINTKSTSPIVASITMRRGADSEKAAWIGSAHDITQRFKQEEALKASQQERTQSLKQLVMGVAHEMNTPLGNIKMAHSFIHDSLGSIDQSKRGQLEDGLNIINESTENLRELGQLMKSSAVVDQKWTAENMVFSEWLQSQLEHLKGEFSNLNIVYENHIPESELSLCFKALQEVMKQLVSNSVYHNQDAYNESNLDIKVIAIQAESRLEIIYQDNGQGIDHETRLSIFQPFYTTRRQHAKSKGLGMYQTYNLISEVLSGEISWPDTEQGFALKITLPLNKH